MERPEITLAAAPPVSRAELLLELVAAAEDFVGDPSVPPFGLDEPHVWPDDRLREHAAKMRELLALLALGDTNG